MSVTELKSRPGWYDVCVYDRVKTRGQKPEKITKRVKGQRAAEKVERDLLKLRDEGLLVVHAEDLNGYATRWLETRRSEVSRATLASYRRVLTRYVGRHEIGKMKVRDVDVTAITGFYADLRERGSVGEPISVETIRGVHRVLSMVLKRASVDGLVRINPCTVAKVPKDDAVESLEDEEPGIDPESARRFVAAAKGTSIETISAIALGTGLRVSELLGLKWEDVDFEAGELHVIGKLEQVDGVIERTALKTKRSRRDVPYDANVAAVFRQQKRMIAEARMRLQKDGWWVAVEQDEHWVFPTLHVSFTHDGDLLPAGRWWPPDSFQKTWRRGVHHANEVALTEYVLAGGKVEDFEPPWNHGIHAHRHAFATGLLAGGVRVEVVSRRLGHSSSLVTLRVYSHVLTTEQREGVDVADGLL